MALGSSVVRGLLPRCLEWCRVVVTIPRCMLLWRNAFPRSRKELESERARGDTPGTCAHLSPVLTWPQGNPNNLQKA